MKKLISFMPVLCLLMSLGTVSAWAEGAYYEPIDIEYYLGGELIHTDFRQIVDVSRGVLPEELRKSFDENYLPADNNDWKIENGRAKIYLRETELVPVNIIYVCGEETVASVRILLSETAKSLPADEVHIPKGYEADGEINLEIADGSVVIKLKKIVTEPEEVLPEEDELMDVGIVYLHKGQRVASVVIQVPVGTEKLSRELAGHPTGYTVDEENDFCIYNGLVTLNVSKAEPSSNPKTGDERSMALRAGLMALSAVSAAIVLSLKKRENL